MMKQKCFTIVALLYISMCFSHTLNEVDITIQPDSIIQDSITKYRKLSTTAYGKGDLESFKKYTDIVLDFAKKNDLKEEYIRAIVNQAIYYQQTDQYNKSFRSI